MSLPGVSSFASGHIHVKSEGVKVICVGMMRTGLKTLHRAFSTLGYQNIYDQDNVLNTFEQWDRVLRDRDLSAIKEIFQGHEVVMGMPTFCFWEQIVDLYPNAKVILTIRDEEDWWQSIQHAWQLMESELPGVPFNHCSKLRWLEQWLAPSYHKYCEALRFAWKTTLGGDGPGNSSSLSEDMVRKSFSRHNEVLQAALEDQILSDGSPRFLVYNVATDGWAPLCNFLDKAVPDEGFPKFTKTSEGGRDVHEHEHTPLCEERLLPNLDSKFADQVRYELRRGLFLGATVTTLIMIFFAAVVAQRLMEVSPCSLVLSCFSILTVGWNVHVVLQGLVLRVPALFVLPTAVKGLLVAGALQACFICYGILKEQLVTQDQIASPLLVLSSRLGAIAFASGYLLFTEGRVTFGAPIEAVAPFAITNEASTWASYEMLKYMAFPVQVMAKSVKMLPGMLMSRFVSGTQYTWLQYSQAVLPFACVVIMNFSDDSRGSPQGMPNPAASENMSVTQKIGMGALMLAFFFVCNSFTSQWQAAHYKKHPKLSQAQMMLGGNMLGFLVTAGTAAAARSKIRASLAIAAAEPAVASRILCLGFVYAVGQFCIYSAIRVLGPLTFTWIMTARQLLSVLISLVLFDHGISCVKVACIFLVFAVISAKQLSPATLALRNFPPKSSEKGLGPEVADPKLGRSDSTGSASLPTWLHAAADQFDSKKAL